MRHRKHNHQLGVKSAHRVSLVANLSCSLIEHGRIKTTLAKARALRPAIEKIITLAKRAKSTDDAAQKVHFRRLAIARLRNKKAVSKLFDELVDQFVNRNGGYTRIYKLAIPRLGDAADMALIEFVEEAPKKNSSKKKQTKKKTEKTEAKPAKDDQEETPASTSGEGDTAEDSVEPVASEEETTESSDSEDKGALSDDAPEAQEEAPSQLEDVNPKGSTESK
jgi:large subunit ribosomal protein L17